MTAAPPPADEQAAADELRQKLAAIEHERWADWQLWCHEVIRKNVGKIDELEDVLTRWDKQAITPYEKLSDTEQISDMEQVDRYWSLVVAYSRTQTEGVLTSLKNFVESESGKSGRKEVLAAIDTEIARLRGKT